MGKPRRFTAEFKRQVVEELLSGITRPAQLSRRHNLSRGLVYHWKKQYAKGKLTLENEFLRKALQNALKEQERKESSFAPIRDLLKVSERDAI